MYHLVNNFQTKTGDALVGYYVKLKDAAGAYATLFADANSTPIATVSSIADTAVTNANGQYDLYVADGDYDVEFYDKSDINTLVSSLTLIPMYGNTSAGVVLGQLADTAAGKGISLTGTTSGRTGQAELDAKQTLLSLTTSVDLVDFGAGAFPAPAITALGLPVHERVNGTAGTLVRGFDTDGFYINTFATGRGGSYIVVPTDEAAVYLRFKGKIKSGGTSPTDQASLGLIFFTDDITKVPYVVPPAAAHIVFGTAVWSVDTVIGVSITAYASGLYPTADTTLALDEEHIIEAAIGNGILYLMVDNVPLAAIPQPLLDTMPGLFPTWEIFKNNTTDNEPKMKDLCYSTDSRVAREMIGRYLQDQVLGLFTGDASSAFSTVDDFIGGNLVSGSVGRLGWSYPASNVTISAAQGTADHPGIVKISTGTTTGTVYYMYLGGAANAPSFSMLNFQQASFIFHEDAAGITDCDRRVGLTSDASTITPTNALYLEHLAADTTWWLVGRGASSQTRYDTGIAAKTTNWISVRFYAFSSEKFGCYIKVNGGAEALVATLDGNAGDHIPVAVNQLPMFQQVITGTTLRTLDVDRFSLDIGATAR